MKTNLKSALMAVVLAALGACNQQSASQGAAASQATQPQGLMEQAQAMPAEQQPVFAYQLLSRRTDLQPPCTTVRQVDARGTVPNDVAQDSIFAPYAGALAFAIQCGPQISGVADDPHQDWLVVLQPGASDATILACADQTGVDRCIGAIPRTAAP